MLSVVIPAYSEEQMIPKTAETVSGILENADIPYELLFVDDGSKDGTWRAIQEEARNNSHIKGIHFSRNFGKESAMFAGLAKAKGDCVAIMDCDLQHPAEKLVEMYHAWEQGFEVVEGVKESRGEESKAHGLAAKLFYKFMSDAVGTDMLDASDFKLLDRKVVDTLNQMPERNVFFRALSFWVGYKRTTVSYSVQERTAGESKWSTWKLFQYAITNITSFTSAPMHIVTVLGVIMFVISCILGIISLVQKIMGVALGGFTTVILIQLFSGSIIMMSLGIIGYYIAKIYDEIKGRPRYIISEICGEDN